MSKDQRDTRRLLGRKVKDNPRDTDGERRGKTLSFYTAYLRRGRWRCIHLFGVDHLRLLGAFERRVSRMIFAISPVRAEN